MMTQRTILRDMLELIAPMVGDSGVCPTTASGQAAIIAHTNRALYDLHKRVDHEGAIFEWYVDVNQGCFALPQECREARQIGINGLPMRQRSEFYIGKIASGPSWEGCCGPWECRDLGDFYIPQPLPKVRGLRIALVALDDGDAGRECIVEITNEYGLPVKETLTLLPQQQPVTMDAVAFDVTFFKKPKTYGPVSLQLQYDNGQRFYFCNYHPLTEEGLFRRKQFPQRFWGCNIARILGKTRWIPITTIDQIVPFNDYQAVRFAVMGESALVRKDRDEYAANMIMALQELKMQMQDADSASNVKQVTVVTGLTQPSLRWQSPCGYGYGNGFAGGYAR